MARQSAQFVPLKENDADLGNFFIFILYLTSKVLTRNPLVFNILMSLQIWVFVILN